MYLNARYLDPATGTFLTRDPFEGMVDNAMSRNPYSYTGGNPVNMISPNGQTLTADGLRTKVMILGRRDDTNRRILIGLAALAVGWAVGTATLGALGPAAAFFVTALGEGSAPFVGAAAIGISGALSGQAVRATNNIGLGRPILEGLGKPGDLALDAIGAIVGTSVFGALTGTNPFTEVIPEFELGGIGSEAIDPVVDNNVLIRAYRAYIGSKVRPGDAEALQLLQNSDYQWKVTPEVYDEFTHVPSGSSDLQQFLNDLPNLDVISASEAQQLQNGETFQKISERLRAIANRSSAGLGDPVVLGGRTHTHYNDIMSLAYAEELGIPFVTEDSTFIRFLAGQDHKNTYNIFHYLNFK